MEPVGFDVSPAPEWPNAPEPTTIVAKSAIREKGDIR